MEEQKKDSISNKAELLRDACDQGHQRRLTTVECLEPNKKLNTSY